MFNWKKIKKKASTTAKRITAKSDELADQLAIKATKWSGKEISKTHIKKAAIAGAMIAFIGIAAEGLTGIESQSFSETDSGSDGFDNSFEGQSNRFFADKGGLNIDTQYIDQDGCQLY